MVFLGINVWVLFVYFRFILRDSDHPWWPYAAASGIAVLLGTWMLRLRAAEEAAEDQTAAGTGAASGA